MSSLLSQECKYCSIPAFWPGYYKMSLVPSRAGSSSEWEGGQGNTQVRGNPKSLQDRGFWGGLYCFLYILDTILGRVEVPLENKLKQSSERNVQGQVGQGNLG